MRLVERLVSESPQTTVTEARVTEDNVFYDPASDYDTDG